MGSMTEPTQSNEAGMQALQEALGTSLRLLRWLILALFIAYLGSGVFVVRQHEKAFVLLLGKLTGTGEERVKEPGLHWTLPRPFSEIIRLPVERVQSLTSSTFWSSPPAGFQRDDDSMIAETLNPERDGYLLTGDANMLHARWTVRFTLSNPTHYLFNYEKADETLLRELDRAILHVTGRFPADRALRTDIGSLREAVETELTRRCAELDLGVRIQGVDLLGITPPLQVAGAFDDVIRAEQERDQQVSEARAYSARTVNEAQGEAARIRVEGETYSRRLLGEIKADADTFKQMLVKYRRSPDVFMNTLLQDTLRRALANVEQKYVVQGTANKAQEIRLQLGPESESEE